MAATKDTASLRKRAQIANANRMMFIWVAGASVIVSVSAVLAITMFQKGMHQQKAITELRATVATLKENNSNVEPLQDSLRALSSDESLRRLRSSDSDNALSVILDALPADANATALGASLQSKLFESIEVESIQVSPILADGTYLPSDGTPAATEGIPDSAPVGIAFQFVVKGSAQDLKSLLTRLERSIRTIQLTNMQLDSVDGAQTLTVSGQAYYQPAKTIQLKDKKVYRNEKN